MLQGQVLEGTSGEVPYALNFEGRCGARRTAATALPDGGEGIGEGNRGAVEDIDASKPSEDRDRYRLGSDELLDRSGNDLVQASRRCFGEALFQALRRNSNADIRRTLGELRQGRLGWARKPKTRAWTKPAPVSWRWRGINPVAVAAVVATVVNTVCKARLRCGMLDTSGSFGLVAIRHLYHA